MKRYTTILLALFIILALTASVNGAVKLGNTPENLSNYGRFASDGEWLYYSNGFYDGKLYKCKLDGSADVKLNDDSADYINVVDGWVYYSSGGLYKIRTDGTGRTCLFKGSLFGIYVLGDWIYYVNLSGKSDGIYKMKTDGKSITRLVSGGFQSMTVYGDWIYFSDGSNLYKIKLDGTRKTTVKKGCYAVDLCVSGDWIYLADNIKNYNLYKIKTDGSKVVKLNSKWTQGIFVYKDWVYYSTLEASGYYRVRTDGTKTEKPDVFKDIVLINAVGDWFYMNTDYQKPYKMKTDLTGKQRLDGIVIKIPADNTKEMLKGTVNKVGNTSANINNDGFAAVQGDWHFYSIFNHDKLLLRQKADGSNTSHMAVAITDWLNPAGEWLYYSNGMGIAKCKLNGSNEIQVYDRFVTNIQVVDGWIYFLEYVKNGNKICRIKIDGTNRKVLSNDNANAWMDIVGGWIYYSNLSDSYYSLYKMKTDGTARIRVDTYYYWKPVITGNSIYYADIYDTKDKYKIFRCDLDGKNKTKISEDPATNINVSGDWIFYSNMNDGNRLYKIRTDGTEKTKLSDVDSSNICILNDWVYFNQGVLDEGYNSYRIKTDGSQFEQLK